MKKNTNGSPKIKNQKIPGSFKSPIHNLPYNERYEMGKQLRELCPRSSHAKWEEPN